ncbi:MAG: plasmid replication initiation factor [Planctomycetes bacterium]|nr:plasmid replication initiation factor [Planctomycetota bacterium]
MNESTSIGDLPVMQPPITVIESGLICGDDPAPGEWGGGPVASAEAPPTGEAGSMASSITCHAPFSNLVGWKCLLSGVDTLYLGIYVEWSELWSEQVELLEAGKLEATGTEGLPVNDGRFLILPSGKPPNYRFHLQFPAFHFYLSHRKEPQKGTPNVYVCIGAKSLWLAGLEASVKQVIDEITLLGGNILAVKPSRCDLAADFLIPEDLSLDFLLSHRVPSHLEVSSHIQGDCLQTFYQGAKSSPIQLRIYDKGLEVEKGGTKQWFLDLWRVPNGDHVWRIEFQLRRPILKAYKVNSIAELTANLGTLWNHLTDMWFSLRLPDDANTTRRTVHPGWLAVQMIDSQFGEVGELHRDLENHPADAAWYIAHVSGCLAGYAARRRIGTVEQAAEEMLKAIRQHWSRRDFATEYSVRSIKLGYDGQTTEEDCGLPGAPSAGDQGGQRP